MSDDENPTEPSAGSRADTPEPDVPDGTRASPEETLRKAFRHAVFVDHETWEHFGGEERILEVLRLLVDIAKKRSAEDKVAAAPPEGA